MPPSLRPRTRRSFDDLRRLVLTDDDHGMAALHANMRADERALVESALDAAVKTVPSEAGEGGAAAPLASRRLDGLLRICESYLANGAGCRSGARRRALVVHVDAGTRAPSVATGPMAPASPTPSAPPLSAR